MAPRAGPKKVRENDYSNVGRTGRRTGVVLPEKKRDEHGIEEITGLFSSPRKPSPLKPNGVNGAHGSTQAHNSTIEESEEMVGIDSSGLEPTQVLSTRKSLRGTPLPPRSASPKKTGINGAARRSGTDFTPSKLPIRDSEDVENTPVEGKDESPARNTSRMRRFNPEKSPLQEQNVLDQLSPRTRRQNLRAAANHASPSATPQGRMNAIVDDILDETEQSTENLRPSATEDTGNEDLDTSYDINPIGDDDDGAANTTHDEEAGETDQAADEEEYSLPNGSSLSIDPEDTVDSIEDEDSIPANNVSYQEAEDNSTVPAPIPSKKSGRPLKRKSDALDATSDTPSKKAKATLSSKAKGKRPVYHDKSPVLPSVEHTPKSTKPAKSNSKSKRAPKPKDSKGSSRLPPEREKELEDVVERIKSRPGPPRSLFLLRRETPTDDSNTRTRSGRVSVKPLAYWKNERCVFGEGSPQNVGLGERFPMTSIKEIVRVEEQTFGESGKKCKKSKSKSKKRPTTTDPDDETDLADGGESEDEHAEPWESATGIFQGYCQDWDEDENVPINEVVETEIAYAASSISTREVKNATFRYAKLLSLPFFGSGIVELPPAATKKTKSSKKMHMCFYVLTGRVTATVAGNRFSVGKGGMWQVPRGNSYAIENELEKEAKLFFSQGNVEVKVKVTNEAER